MQGRFLEGLTGAVVTIRQKRGDQLFATKWDESCAVFSPCMVYRYALSRTWDGSMGKLVVIGLNPSTADQDANDPTIERIERRSRACGYGGLVMLNLFALRATDPCVMFDAVDPVGKVNDEVIERAVVDRDVLCAWGVHGSHRGRDAQVMKLIRGTCRTLCLGTTKGGAPRHPLYVAYSVALREFVL